jgi:hypothetical protein
MVDDQRGIDPSHQGFSPRIFSTFGHCGSIFGSFQA